jgi:hypothetical protein
MGTQIWAVGIQPALETGGRVLMAGPWSTRGMVTTLAAVAPCPHMLKDENEK